MLFPDMKTPLALAAMLAMTASTGAVPAAQTRVNFTDTINLQSAAKRLMTAYFCYQTYNKLLSLLHPDGSGGRMEERAMGDGVLLVAGEGEAAPICGGWVVAAGEAPADLLGLLQPAAAGIAGDLTESLFYEGFIDGPYPRPELAPNTSRVYETTCDKFRGLVAEASKPFENTLTYGEGGVTLAATSGTLEPPVIMPLAETLVIDDAGMAEALRSSVALGTQIIDQLDVICDR